MSTPGSTQNDEQRCAFGPFVRHPYVCMILLGIAFGAFTVVPVQRLLLPVGRDSQEDNDTGEMFFKSLSEARTKKPMANSPSGLKHLPAATMKGISLPAATSKGESLPAADSKRHRAGLPTWKIRKHSETRPAFLRNFPHAVYPLGVSSHYTASLDVNRMPLSPEGVFHTAKPMRYKLSCGYKDAVFAADAGRAAGERLLIHILTDNVTLAVRPEGYLNALLERDLDCRSAEPGETAHDEIIALRYAHHVWRQAEAYLWLLRLRAKRVNKSRSARGVVASRNMRNFERTVASGLIALRELIVKGKTPVLVLASDEVDPIYTEIANLLEAFGVPPGMRFTTTSTAAFSATNGQGKLRVPAQPGPAMTRQVWLSTKPTEFAKYAPGTPRHVRAYFWNPGWWSYATRNTGNRAFCSQAKPRRARADSNTANSNMTIRVVDQDTMPHRVELLFELWLRGLLPPAVVDWKAPLPRECCKGGSDCSKPGGDPNQPSSNQKWQRSRFTVNPKFNEFCGAMRAGKAEPAPLRRGKSRDKVLSLLFELQTAPGVYKFTHVSDKPMKPMYDGSPFVVLCGTAGSLDVFRSFGFKTFAPMIGEDYDENPRWGRCFFEGDAPAERKLHTDAIADAIRRVALLSDSEWASLAKVSRHNQRHLRCGGFEKAFRSHTRGILKSILTSATKARAAGTS